LLAVYSDGMIREEDLHNIHVNPRRVTSRVDDRRQSEVIALLKILDGVVNLFELFEVRELNAGRHIVDVFLDVSRNVVS